VKPYSALAASLSAFWRLSSTVRCAGDAVALSSARVAARAAISAARMPGSRPGRTPGFTNL